jgi:choline-sulfatase
MAAKSPNILLIMADQLSASALPCYGHRLVQAPNLQRLAGEGRVYDNAYCNSPLCAPSRFSMLSGQLISRIGAYDNAAEFSAAVPTVAHYLRRCGYRTALGGKMHFVGPDQLHGFEQRLTTDIYPADFGWTANWEEPERRYSWFHNMDSVLEAGVSARTMQIDFDDAAAFAACRAIYDFARDGDERPFFLCVSFTHPHDPYNTDPEHWGRYRHDDIDPPAVPCSDGPNLDPHSRRLLAAYGADRDRVTDEHVRNARHAYYGAVSYVDDKIGELLAALQCSGLARDTIVLFTADHGDMLGERGLWYKMTFFEGAARVPLMIHAPGMVPAGRVAPPVSLVDLLPTLVEVAGDGAPPDPVEPLDGASLLSVDPERMVAGEYFAEGTRRPIVMLRRGAYKYVHAEGDPAQLYDLEADPQELCNRAGDPELAEVECGFAKAVAERWDFDRLTRKVIRSQRRRLFVFDALMTGRRTLWDYTPPDAEARRYVRNDGEALQDQERLARLAPTGTGLST